MPTLPDWPTDAEAAHLAAELLADDPNAPSEIATQFLEPLARHLRNRYPTTDPDLCEEAAEQAILDTVTRRNRFAPARRSLRGFLCMAAEADLKNLRQREARRARAIPLTSVAEAVAAGKEPPDGDDGPSWDDPRLVEVIATFEPSELVAFRMMQAGERDTVAFAHMLGLPDAPADELAAAVKRYKDRIKKRLARAVGGTE